MNGKDRDRSFSEVTDTLRYFNSMASSHSWCCSDHDYEDSSPSLALLGLNQLDLPLGISKSLYYFIMIYIWGGYMLLNFIDIYIFNFLIPPQQMVLPLPLRPQRQLL